MHVFINSILWRVSIEERYFMWQIESVFIQNVSCDGMQRGIPLLFQFADIRVHTFYLIMLQLVWDHYSQY